MTTGPIQSKEEELDKDVDGVVEWQEFVSGVRQGAGHFVGINKEGNIVQAHFVNVGKSEEGRHATSSRARGHQWATPPDALQAKLTAVNLTERKWRELPATANERQSIVWLGRQLEQRGMSARKVSAAFNLAPSTYSNWKRRAEPS